ncbi:MAG: hypothetical protein NTV00_04250 [Methylococcales bacterium]|nr:hypothetical protein [Methylococcales bacterium]
MATTKLAPLNTDKLGAMRLVYRFTVIYHRSYIAHISPPKTAHFFRQLSRKNPSHSVRIKQP